jgi:hypothetical protein
MFPDASGNDADPKRTMATRRHRIRALLRGNHDGAAAPPAPPAAGGVRLEALTREYEMLRQDDRSYPPVMVAMASAAALVGGTSVFFLLRGCGVSATAGCTSYPGQVYALLPAPSLAVTALLVQQAVSATIRGRLLLAVEAALSSELGEEYALGPGTVPIHSTYHAQQPMHHDARGAIFWTIVFTLPLVVLVGLIYYCGLKLYGADRWVFYCGYTFLVLIIAWGGLPVLRGYRALDTGLYRYMQQRREDGRFKI